MSIEPSQAPSMRPNAVRLLPSSTTAMFMGTPISSALARAASTTAWAALRVTVSPTVSSLSVFPTRFATGVRTSRVPGDHMPRGVAAEVAPLTAEGSEFRQELDHVTGEELRFLEGGEVSAAGHLGPAAQIGEDSLSPLSRGPDDLGGEVSGGRRDPDHLAGVKPPAIAALTQVEPHRGSNRPGCPVHGQEVAELILREPSLHLAPAVAPSAVFLDQPRGKPRRRVVEGARAGAGARRLQKKMMPLPPAPARAGLDVSLLGLAQRRLREVAGDR